MNPTLRKVLLRGLLPACAMGAIAYFVYARTKASEARAAAASSGESGAASSGAPRPPGAQGAVRAVPVLTANVEVRDVPVWLDGLGTVVAFKQVTVHSQVDGRLDAVFFREGQLVHRGDALAQIDPRPFQVQLHQAEGALARDRAQLDGNKLNLERFKSLRKDNLIAQQQVDDQAAVVGTGEGAVLVDQAAVESARLNLTYAHVTAPIEGVVGVRLVDPGNLVHASDATGLVVLTQLDPAAVFITLPQDDLPRLSAALAKSELTVEAWSRDGATRLSVGKLAVIDNQINQATSTLRLKAILPNPARQLWPNQFVKARVLLTTEHDAVVIPAASVQRGPQGTFVYTVGKDKTAAAAPIKVAFVSGDQAVIAEGLTPGQQVVTEGQNQLRPGTPLTPRPVPGSLQKSDKVSGNKSDKPADKQDGKTIGKVRP